MNIADAPPDVVALADAMVETIYAHFGGTDKLRGNAETRAAVLTALAAIAAMTIEAYDPAQSHVFFQRVLEAHIARYRAENAAQAPTSTSLQ